MLAHPILPEVLVSPCLDPLQKASQDDAEFIATTLEVIQAISQSTVLETSLEISNEGLKAMFMRLVVCNGLLERVQWVGLHSSCLTIVQRGYTDESIG